MWEWGSAGKAVIEKLPESQREEFEGEPVFLCNAALRLGPHPPRQPLLEPRRAGRPLSTPNCDHTVCFIGRQERHDWWLCIVSFSFGLLFLRAVKPLTLLLRFDVFPNSSDPVICFHSPACVCFHPRVSVFIHLRACCVQAPFRDKTLIRLRLAAGVEDEGVKKMLWIEVFASISLCFHFSSPVLISIPFSRVPAVCSSSSPSDL